MNAKIRALFKRTAERQIVGYEGLILAPSHQHILYRYYMRRMKREYRLDLKQRYIDRQAEWLAWYAIHLQ